MMIVMPEQNFDMTQMLEPNPVHELQVKAIQHVGKQIKTYDELAAENQKMKKIIENQPLMVTKTKYDELKKREEYLASRVLELQADNDRLNNLAINTDVALQNERYRANKQADDLKEMSKLKEEVKRLRKAVQFYVGG